VILFLILFGIFVSGLRIAREYQRAVVFGFGRTRYSVTVKVNAVLGFASTIPRRPSSTVENFRAAVQQVALTSLRNVIGSTTSTKC
jgi:regulator of protease activity HflC (stomatin/prohibitin superfamily)